MTERPACVGAGRVGRFPVSPLLDAAAAGSVLAFARRAGVHPRQVHRARHHGLTWAMADRWAVAAGLHPVSVWGDAWWEGL